MARGGLRANSGRRKNSNVYRQPTKPMRIPVSLIPWVEQGLAQSARTAREGFGCAEGIAAIYRSDDDLQEFTAPLYATSVSAGFPSPADDHLDRNLDLNSHLIRHPAATFFVRVNGDSMINAGIYHNDMLIVDRSLTPKQQDIVIAVVDGELTVKRLVQREGRVILMPENHEYPPIEISESMIFSVWGVVTTVIHAVR